MLRGVVSIYWSWIWIVTIVVDRIIARCRIVVSLISTRRALWNGWGAIVVVIVIRTSVVRCVSVSRWRRSIDCGPIDGVEYTDFILAPNHDLNP